MRTGYNSFGKRLARTLIAYLAVMLAFGRPLDDLAHVAGLEIEAGNSSPIVAFIAAFDVIDDPMDHKDGNLEQTQLVIQLAMPERNSIGFATIVEGPVEHSKRLRDVVTSRWPPPLERPPRA